MAREAETANPFEGLVAQNEINAVFEEAARRRKQRQVPDVRIFAEGEDLVVLVETPATTPEDVSFELAGGVLRLRVRGAAR